MQESRLELIRKMSLSETASPLDLAAMVLPEAPFVWKLVKAL